MGSVVSSRWPFDQIRRGEGASVAVFSVYAFILLVCYYLLKTMREPLLLEGSPAATKSYAYAVIAMVLLVLVPAYGTVFRRTDSCRLLKWVSGAFAAGLMALSVLGRSGADIGFLYYVWISVFGLLTLAQLWAQAAQAFRVERGQRLFPVIMVGAVCGGLLGPLVYNVLVLALTPWDLMLLVAATLVAAFPLVERMSAPADRFCRDDAIPPQQPRVLLGDFSQVLRDRYLLLLAAMAVLLNCVNATGEYLLADLVVRHADARAAIDPALDERTIIGGFYANYYLSINILATFFQVFVVGRLFRWVGVRGALRILPLIVLVGYGLVALIPAFNILRIFKVVGRVGLATTVVACLAVALPARAEAGYLPQGLDRGPGHISQPISRFE